MANRYTQRSLQIINGILLSILIYSCASIGNPNGGPYDEDPPKFISSTPKPNQINHKGKKIEILFDELIQLEKPSENVIITPPQKQMPVIRAIGKKVSVELKDTLIDDITYTIDFTNSIVDNNEKNVLENFTFAFSTGNVIDTLEIAGILLNAENLEPMPGITVGLHSNLEDSAFVNEVFTRTSRTNERGRFTIRNITPGTYRLYALNDLNRDYTFDATEDIAFEEIPITPSFEFAERMDTVWRDSLTVDTIKLVSYTRFLPDDVTLFLFKEEFERQYMLRPERQENHLFALKFNAPLDTVPQLMPFNFEPADSSWYVVQETEGGRVANFWITDSTVWKQDSLQVTLTYPVSDSLNVLVPKLDTLLIPPMRRRATESRRSRRNEEEAEPITFLGVNVNASSSMNRHDTLFVTFNEPVREILPEMFYLDQKQDTLWVPVEFELEPDSTNSLRYMIRRDWNYGEEYRLEMDSATIFSVYDHWNNTHSGTFKIKTREEYGHLYINIHGIEENAFVELLDKSDQPIRKAKVIEGGALFMDLKPDTYYARMVIDANDNGVWDTGNYAEKRQPEKVYYCPKQMVINVNWETEEDWDVLGTPVEKQKPLEITKNKPQEKQQRQRDYRNEGRGQSSSRNSGRGGLSF
ncbi:Ig-like domain-containing protein [Parabacteroides sp. OttesenSCG-928-K15]|nr:Ig-like domain-containing protein [Parabacteroides sp. OttesenSCG-928-K15]